jgi:hypothetical protein
LTEGTVKNVGGIGKNIEGIGKFGAGCCKNVAGYCRRDAGMPELAGLALIRSGLGFLMMVLSAFSVCGFTDRKWKLFRDQRRDASATLRVVAQAGA